MIKFNYGNTNYAAITDTEENNHICVVKIDNIESLVTGLSDHFDYDLTKDHLTISKANSNNEVFITFTIDDYGYKVKAEPTWIY